jgi:hypothetical protein
MSSSSESSPFGHLPVPEEFFSEYEKRAFQSCTRCGEYLPAVEEGYQICKLFRDAEAIYEYALCHPCHLGVVRQFSQESRQRLELYYSEHVAMNLGRHQCAVCGNERYAQGEVEFSITGAFRGREMLHELMMCGCCKASMAALLSPETRQVWDDFVRDNLPGLPAESPSPSELIPV